MDGEAWRCSRCKGWVLSHELHCVRCGPEAIAPPPPTSSFAQAELDLPPHPSPAPAPPPAPPSRSVADDPLDDPLEPPAGEAGTLRLDEGALLEASVPRPLSRPPAAPSPPAPGATGSNEETDAASNPAPAAEEPPLSEEDVQEVASWGAAPEGWLGSVFYTIRVLQRRRELASELAECRLASRAARRASEEALLALADPLAQGAGQTLPKEARTRLAPWLRACEQARESLRRAEGQRGDEAGALRERIARLREDIERAEREAAPTRNEEARAQAKLRLAEGEVRDVQGRCRRLELELRNLRAMPSADPSRIEELEASLQARRAEEALATRKLEAEREAIHPIRRRLTERLQAIEQLQTALREAESALARIEEEHGAALQTLHAAHRAARIRLGEAALSIDPPESLHRAWQHAERARRTWLARRRRERLVEAARSAWDRPALYRGAGLLGGSALLVIVALLVAIFR